MILKEPYYKEADDFIPVIAVDNINDIIFDAK
jgi:hypothetical protein